MRALDTKRSAPTAAIALLAAAVAVGCGESGSSITAARPAAASSAAAGAVQGHGAKPAGSAAAAGKAAASGGGKAVAQDASGSAGAAQGSSGKESSAAQQAGGASGSSGHSGKDRGGGGGAGAVQGADAVAPAKPSSNGGGQSVSPGIFEHVANRGSVGALKVSNTTSLPMTVKLALRPWLQSRSSVVSPNRRATLPDVRVGSSSFALAAGTTQTIGVTLTRTPRNRSLYGAIEATGTPQHAAKRGITVAYRLVSSLRLDAPKGAQSFRASAGGLVEQGDVKHGTLLLAVRNTGNTIVPIGGNLRISGQGHSLSGGAVAKAIVPGQTVNVPLNQLLGSLPRGRYTVTVSLTQGGHSLGRITRGVYLR